MLEIMDLFLQESADLDQRLGLNVGAIEAELLNRARRLRPEGDLRSWGSALHEGNQTWVGLSLETLQTPYAELRHMCELAKLGPGDRVVDLGAGYGRLGFILARFYPEAEFLGFEYVRERVEEGQRVFKALGLSKSTLLEQDLTAPDFILPVADCYFIYDYGKLEHIRATLGQLSAVADHHRFRVIARGKGTRGLIEREHPWLADVAPPAHEENFSVYFMSP